MIIKKDGFYFEDEKVDDLALHLNDDISIEEDITLENLFDILIEFEELDLLFKSWTRGFKFENYYEELKSDSDVKETEMLYLEVYNVAEYFSYVDDDCNTIKPYESYVSISGVSKETNYSISFTPLNSIKDLLVKVNEDYIIPREFDEDPKRQNPLFKGTKGISLYDFIGCILNEISFHGYREHKEEVMEELDDRIEKIDIGEAETISHEDFMIEILEKDLKRLIKEEKFERAEMVKKEIEELKNEKH